MRQAAAAGLGWAVVVALPVVLVGNALWLLLGPWLVDAQYALPGFPGDAYGLDGDQRAELAETGVRAVRPFGDGVELLREARLPSGRPAFGAAEISHMQDVRDLVAAFLVAWAAALALAAAAAVALWSRGRAAATARAGAARRLLEGGAPADLGAALALGALATLAAMAAIGAFAAVAFDAFFAAFHGLFFEGDSWRFADTATLRRLYPDAFWAIAAAATAALVALQAAVLAVAARRARR